MLTIINLNFETDQVTKDAIKKLKSDLESERFELFPGAPMLTLEESFEVDDGIFLEFDDIRKKGNSVRIEAEEAPPLSFAQCIDSFFSLGATSLSILECIDVEKASSSYYVREDKVSQLDYYRNFYGEAFLTDNFLAKNFLVDQRQKVTASLRKSKWEKTATGNCYMEFDTLDDKQFIYRGLEGLQKMANGSYKSTVTFKANFELSKLGGKLLSFATHPAQIEFEKHKLEAAPEFKGENKKFYEAISGKFLNQYIVDYNSNIQDALLSLTPNSVCGIPFEQFLELIPLVIERNGFSAFGLVMVGSSYNNDNYNEDLYFKIAGGHDWLDKELDVPAIAQYLQSQSIEIDEIEGDNISTVWLSGKAKVGLRVNPRGFRIMVTDENVDHNKLSFH